MIATIYEIAKLTGILSKTVSNVITGRLEAKRFDAVKRAACVRKVAQ